MQILWVWNLPRFGTVRVRAVARSLCGDRNRVWALGVKYPPAEGGCSNAVGGYILPSSRSEDTRPKSPLRFNRLEVILFLWLAYSWSAGRILVGLKVVEILPVRVLHPKVETHAVVVLAPEAPTLHAEVNIRMTSRGLIQFVDSGRRVAKQCVLFASGIFRRNFFHRVPIRMVGQRKLVDRKIRLKHAA